MIKAIGLFLVAGLAEIGGGYLMWVWVKDKGSPWFGLIGGLVLVLYGIIPTFQSFPSFGRVYAAYGGVFIILSLLWGWSVDKQTPDLYDWIGSLVCLIGAGIIIFAPRS